MNLKFIWRLNYQSTMTWTVTRRGRARGEGEGGALGQRAWSQNPGSWPSPLSLCLQWWTGLLDGTMWLQDAPMVLSGSTECHTHNLLDDSLTRHYVYTEETRSFSSLGDLEYHNRCILTVSHLVLPTHRVTATESTLCLLSAATDGRVAVWTPLVPEDSSSGPTSSASHSGSEETAGKCIHPLTVCQAHQSGVNDLSIRKGQVDS